jgi:hypothetical protein
MLEMVMLTIKPKMAKMTMSSKSTAVTATQRGNLNRTLQNGNAYTRGFSFSINE